MTTAIEKAREAGIEIHSMRSDYRTTCPACSPNRRNSKDPCLHVTIGRSEVKFNCFHCEAFKGVFTDDDERRDHAGLGGKGHRRRAGGASRVRQHAPRWY